MEPHRFDDVDTRIVEEPPPRPRGPRVGTAVLAVTAALALTGSLAAGASALTSTAQAPTITKTSAKQTHRWGSHHGLCHKGDRSRSSAPTALSY